MKTLITIAISILVTSESIADHRAHDNDHSKNDPDHGYYYHGGAPRGKRGPVGTYQPRFDDKNYGYDYRQYESIEKRRAPAVAPYGHFGH